MTETTLFSFRITPIEGNEIILEFIKDLHLQDDCLFCILEVESTYGTLVYTGDATNVELAKYEIQDHLVEEFDERSEELGISSPYFTLDIEDMLPIENQLQNLEIDPRNLPQLIADLQGVLRLTPVEVNSHATFIVEILLGFKPKYFEQLQTFVQNLERLGNRVHQLIHTILILPNIRREDIQQWTQWRQKWNDLQTTVKATFTRLSIPFQWVTDVELRVYQYNPLPSCKNIPGQLRNKLLEFAQSLLSQQTQQSTIRTYHMFIDTDCSPTVDRSEESIFEFYIRKGIRHNWPKIMSGGFTFTAQQSKDLKFAYHVSQSISRKTQNILPGFSYISEANTVMLAEPHDSSNKLYFGIKTAESLALLQ